MEHDIDATANEGTRGPIARRMALRTLGAAAAGGVAGLFAMNGLAEATTGAMQYGTSNDAGTSVTTLTSTSTDTTLRVTNTNTIGLGYPLVASGGKAQLHLAGTVPSPLGVQIEHLGGELVYDDQGVLWVCVQGGSPGLWRRLAAPESAGTFHVIAPSRVYDSRRPTTNRLNSGDQRGVYVGDKVDNTGATVEADIVPDRATAISYTVTVVGTQGTNGYLAVNPGNVTEVSASTINWSATGQTLANSSVVGITKFRDINVICGGTNTSCNFIIDVLGYYL